MAATEPSDEAYARAGRVALEALRQVALLRAERDQPVQQPQAA